MTILNDLSTPVPITWCPGCGNFPLWLSFKNAAVSENWNNENTTLIAGIGCHGHLVNYTKLTSFEGLHGRALPVAEGIKVANSKLNVFVFTGDGDCFGEGGNHFIHACRRNHNLTVILHNNGLYSLTVGQASPLTEHDVKTKSTPFGNPDYSLNPVAMAITAGATFVARCYASDIKNLTEIFVEANKHKGFSFIDVLQPCETFEKTLTHKFYQENTYHLEDSYDSTNKFKAYERSFEFGEKKIPVGIFYKEEKETFESQFDVIKNDSLVNSKFKKENLENLFNNFV